jgi:hypothetical protein
MEPRLMMSVAAHPAVDHALKKTVSAAASSVQISVDIAPRTTPVSKTAVAKTAKTKKNTGSAATPSDASPSTSGTTYPNGILTPAQIRGAYLGTNFNFDGIAGDGTGQTIAIVDVYDNPGFVNSSSPNFATSDLAEFDAYYHLPNPPSFTKYGVNSNTGTVTTTLPGDDPNGPVSTTGKTDWELEEALDVEWAHVIAPQASIVLVEATNISNLNLYSAVEAAAALPGVSVVSMSFGQDETRLGSGSESTYNALFDVGSGITYVASAGDAGAYGSNSTDNSTSAIPQFPAASQYVVAVGGTTLSAFGNSWSSETTWGNGTSSKASGGGGGGTSAYIAKPAYQAGFGSGSNRQYPDVSLDGNANASGVAVYDTYDFGSGNAWCYGAVGGTSLAAPLMAGIVAVADQGRALRGLQPLNSNGLSGGTDVHTLLYSLAGSSTSYAADLHDITTGNDTGPAGPPPNFSAETGYDLASGLGSPVAYNLATDLAYYNISAGSSSLAINQPAITSLYYKQDSSSAYTDVWVNSTNPGTGSPTYKFADADISAWSFLGTTGTGKYTIDLSGGTAFISSLSAININPSPTGINVLTVIGPSTGGTAFTTGAGFLDFGSTVINFSTIYTLNIDPSGAANTLTVDGTASSNDSYAITSSSFLFDGIAAIDFSDISNLYLDPGAGTESLLVSSGSVTITPQTPGGGILTRNFSSINVSSGATAIFATAAAHTDRMLVETASLSVLGQLDLGGNDMIIHNGSLASISALLAGGYANGSWNGIGIDSAAAHSDSTHLTALGVIQNTLYGNTLYGGTNQPQFDGTNPLSTDVLIKYTYYGDTNLDGKVDGTDYSRVDVAYTNHSLTGWFNGDFNYDHHTDGSDYTLLDNAFNSQGNPL